MPGSSQPGINVYSRININWQEVFTICDAQGVFISSFHLALSPLEQAYGQSLNIMFEKHPLLTSTEHFYEPGGQDQLHIEIEGAENALTLLQDTNIVRAIRLFNFRLMKKGSCAYSRYHCMDLADKLLNP